MHFFIVYALVLLAVASCSSVKSQGQKKNIQVEIGVDIPEINELLNIKNKDSSEYSIAVYKAAYATLRHSEILKKTGRTKASIRLLYVASGLMPWRDDLRKSYEEAIGQYKGVYLKSLLSCGDYEQDLEFMSMYAPDLLKSDQVKQCHFKAGDVQYQFADYLERVKDIKEEKDIVRLMDNNLQAQLEEEIYYSEKYFPLRDYVTISYLRSLSLMGRGNIVCNRFSVVTGSKKGHSVSLDAKCITNFSLDADSFRKGGAYLREILEWSKGTRLYPLISSEDYASFILYPVHNEWGNKKKMELIKGWGVDLFRTSELIAKMIARTQGVYQGGVSYIVPMKISFGNEAFSTVMYKMDVTSLVDSRRACTQNTPGYERGETCRDIPHSYRFDLLQGGDGVAPSRLMFKKNDKEVGLRFNNIPISSLSQLKTLTLEVDSRLMLTHLMKLNGLDIAKMSKD